MIVRRIVPNIQTDDPDGCATFYAQVFGLDRVMDMGWIATMQAATEPGPMQLSLASQGGSDTPVPALSIEVDDLETALQRLEALGVQPEYGPVTEPWGVRRFYVRDPAGTLLNIVTHQS